MKQPRTLDMDRIEQARRKRRRRKRRLAVLSALAVLVLVIWLTGIGSRYYTRLSTVFETLQLQLRPGLGFPVSLAMESDTRAGTMTSAAVLMDGRDIYVYSDTGSSLRTFRHGYARPGLTVGDARFCVYNRGGRELRIEGRTQSYGALTTAKAIQFVTMSQNGNFAVVTQSDSYQAQMNVYSYTMDELFSWYCANEYPTTAAFSPSGKEVAVGCVTSRGGALQSVLYLVNAEGERLSLGRENCLILDIAYRGANRLLVAYDDALILYNTNDMTPLASYSLTDALLCCDLQGDKGILAVQGDASREAGVSLTVLTEDLEVLRTVAVGDAVTQCAMHGNCAWLIGKTAVFCYTIEEIPDGDRVVQMDDRPVCLVAGGRNLLLLTAQQLVELDAG